MCNRARILTTLVIVLCLGSFTTAEELHIRAESPQAIDGEIDGTQDFQIDLAFDYTGTIDWMGGTFGIYFYSPDNTLSHVIHRDVGGDGPYNSITYSTLWENTFTALNQVNFDTEYGFNGELPDSAYQTALTFSGMAPNIGEQIHITYHMAAEEAVGGNGTLCIDSAGPGLTVDYDWLFPDDIHAYFNGPYCWDIYNLTSSGNRPEIVCPDDLSLTCGEPIDPDWTGYATATDDIDPDPEITYTDTYSSPECPYVLTRTWKATDNDGYFSTCTQTIAVGARPIYHVRINGNDIYGDGSEESPFRTISKALTFAIDGDSILVHPGVYDENVVVTDYAVNIHGLGGREQTWINAAVVDLPAVTFQDIAQTGGSLSGITVGYATGAPGILIENASPIIEQCGIENNHNSGAGGGILADGSAAIIRNNLIQSNSSETTGGGIAVYGVAEIEMGNNEIYLNDAPLGAGISVNSGSVQAANAYIHHNLIRDNIITDDFSDGIYINGLNCRVINNTIVNNKRGIRFVDGYGSIVFNNIITGCVDDGLFPWGAVYDYNDIWDNGGNDNNPGPNGLFMDPLYADPANNDYTLLPNSPCMDAGNPDPAYNDPNGTRNDMGAFPVILGNLPIAFAINFGSENPDNVIFTAEPVFYWSYYGSDEGGQVQYQIQVGTDDDWTTAEMWDSGPVTSAEQAVQYEGSALQDNAIYYLRIRVSDGIDWGDWNGTSFTVRIFTTYYVPDDFGTIQAAIDGADILDLILVRPGTYVENLDFQGKDVRVKSLDGPGSTILTPSNPDAATINFKLGGNGGTIFSGFTVTGGGDANTIEINSPVSLTIENNIFRDNVYTADNEFAVINIAYGAPVLRRNVFFNNGAMNAIFIQSSGEIVNNTVVDNRGGIVSVSNNARIFNNIISENEEVGLSGYYGYKDYNCIWHNGTSDPLSPHSLNEDPHIINPYAGDFRLERISPCRDAGNPDAEYDDPDGTRNDIGASYAKPISPFAENINYGEDAFSDTVLTSSPTVYWDYFDFEATTQTAFNIQASVTPDWSGEPFWDSGIISSEETEFLMDGADFLDRTRYYIRIRLNNGNDWGDWLYSSFLPITDKVLEVPGDYATISEAINNCMNGDTILVGPGTYVENIVYPQTRDVAVISVAGPKETFLKHPGDNSTPLITASYGQANGIFEGFDISGVSSGLCIFKLMNDIQAFRISNNIIHDNTVQYVIYSEWGYWIKSEITRNIFANASTGYIFQGSISDSKINNNTIAGGNNGFKFYLEGGEILNNIITGLSGDVFQDSDPLNQLDYNDIWNNPGGDMSPGPHGIAADPQFTDPDQMDFSLLSTSPCREAGHPGIEYNDIDGTRNDIGAVAFLMNLPVATGISYGPDAEGRIVFTNTPDFEWTYFDTLETTQGAYHIQVGTDQDWTEAEMWDSGPVTSAETNIAYDGTPLEENNLYFIRIRVSNGSDWGGWAESRFLIYGGEILVPQHFSTIKEAIDFAPEGSRILVSPGTYNENIILGEKSLILESSDGPGQTYLEPLNRDLSTVTFGGNGSTTASLIGFTVRGGGQTVTVMINESADATIENNIFFDNISGVVNPLAVIKNLGVALIRKNLFYNNGGICSIWATGYTRIINNTLANNTRGIYNQSTLTVVYNNIIVGCDDYAFFSQGGEPAAFDYNDIWNNSPNYSGGPNGISINPLFVDPLARDYRLQLTSPCLNSGNPDPEYNDPDGTRNDMGAYPRFMDLPMISDFSFGPDAFGHIIFGETPVFNWTYFDSPPSTQAQYQIQVSSDQDWSSADLWDSGPVVSDQNSVVYDGLTLPVTTRVYIRIRVHNGTDWGAWYEDWFTLSFGDIINVPEQFPTIQEAIDNAPQLAEIQVAPGTYYDNIEFQGKSVIIRSTEGSDATFLRPSNPSLPTIRFTGGEEFPAGIDGFTVEGGGQTTTVGISIGSSVRIAHNVFRQNIDGVANPLTVIRIDGTAEIIRNLFYGNGGINTIWSNGSGTIINNTISNNTRGVYSTSSGTILLNNIVCNNTDYGVLGSYAINDYNDVWNNGTENNPGPNGLTIDPLFMNPPTHDFTLSYSSPCVDAGNPGPQYNDPDGSRNDIGAFPVLRDLPVAMNINYGPNSSGDTVFTLQPEIRWAFYNDEEKPQTAYQIQVGTDNNWDTAELWDSGEIISQDSGAIYEGAELSDHTVYFLRIRVSDEDDWGGWLEKKMVLAIFGTYVVPDEFGSIQEAINAIGNRDTVLVKPGMYTENINFNGKNIVVLSSEGPEETIIQAHSTSNSIVTFDKESISRDAVIEGFTIRGTDGAPGISCINASPTIRNCVITDCFYSEDGGGIWCRNSQALIVKNEIFGNGCSKTGAGIGGRGSVGPEIAYNYIHDNASGSGCGIGFVSNTPLIYIHHNLIVANSGSGGYSGGVYIDGHDSQIHNNTIVGNTSGITLRDGTNIDIRNNIVVGNEAIGISPANGVVDYNDVWNNQSYNDPGPNGISLDPFFFDSEIGDYNLGPNSPCIDAGDPAAEFNDEDGTRGDIGAFPFNLVLPYALDINFGAGHSDHVPNSLTPTINWTFKGETGAVQYAYQIQVGTDLNWDEAEMWDSGPVESDIESAVYSGNELTDRKKYYLRIRLNDGSEWGSWFWTWFRPRLNPIVVVPDQFATIQEAIFASFDGDTVLVKPGTYREHINFDGKSILVKSTASPSLVKIVAVTEDTPVVIFDKGETRNTILEGLTIDGNGMSRAIGCLSSSPIIRNCRIINSNGNMGGAVILLNSGALITECTIENNVSNDYGSALYMTSNSQGVEFSYNTIRDNTCRYGTIFLSPYYNPVSDISVHNNLFFDNINNQLDYQSGTIYGEGIDVRIYNNTIVNNDGGILLFNYPYVVYNNIVVGNGGIGISIPDGDVDYNDVWNNEMGNDPGPHGFSLDPEFTDPANNLFGLKHYSPCIDAGNPDEFYNDPDGSRNDIGAYPYGTGPSAEEVIPTTEWINLYCSAAQLDGVPLNEGDIIKAYDPSGVLCGMDTVDAEGGFGFMPVYRDFDATSIDEGAEPGDRIHFAVNNRAVNPETEIVWNENGQSYEICGFNSTMVMEIPLKTGWNLVSWNLDTPDDDIESICQEIMDNVITVQSFEWAGLTYDPELPEFSTLTEADHYHGYWFNMSGEANLVIEGSLVAPGTPIDLEYGWNLVSYLPDDDLPVADALETVHDQLDLVLGWENGQPLTYDPGLPEYSSLETMKKGLGYWLRVRRQMPLVYPGIHGTSDPAPAKAFASDATDTVSVSRLWLDIYGKSLSLNEDRVVPGTKIRIIDDENRLIGVGRVETDGRFGFIPVYGDDPLTEVCEGPKAGEKFRLVIGDLETAERFEWKSDSGPIEISHLTVSGKYRGIPEDFALLQNYPNPFNPETTIEFGLPQASEWRIEIYNILGRKVREYSGYNEAGYVKVTWDASQHASGVYFYRARAKGFSETKKMLLVK